MTRPHDDETYLSDLYACCEVRVAALPDSVQRRNQLALVLRRRDQHLRPGHTQQADGEYGREALDGVRVSDDVRLASHEHQPHLVLRVGAQLLMQDHMHRISLRLQSSSCDGREQARVSEGGTGMGQGGEWRRGADAYSRR